MSEHCTFITEEMTEAEIAELKKALGDLKNAVVIDNCILAGRMGGMFGGDITMQVKRALEQMTPVPYPRKIVVLEETFTTVFIVENGKVHEKIIYDDEVTEEKPVFGDEELPGTLVVVRTSIALYHNREMVAEKEWETCGDGITNGFVEAVTASLLSALSEMRWQEHDEEPQPEDRDETTENP